MQEEEEEEETMLDDQWMRAFKEDSKLYKDFYKDDIWHINLCFLYVNRENEIDCMRQETFLMSKPNRMLEAELLQILKRSSTHNRQRYSLISILRYNLLLEPCEVKHYLNNGEDKNYLTVVTNFNDIVFGRTIAMFHDINDLVFVFYEKPSVTSSSVSAMTKRVYLQNHKIQKFKKTIRKRYKD
jgi:hypothetical protein